MNQGQATAEYNKWKTKAPDDMAPFENKPNIINPRATASYRPSEGKGIDNRFFICIDEGIEMIVIYPGIGRDSDG